MNPHQMAIGIMAATGAIIAYNQFIVDADTLKIILGMNVLGVILMFTIKPALPIQHTQQYQLIPKQYIQQNPLVDMLTNKTAYQQQPDIDIEKTFIASPAEIKKTQRPSFSIDDAHETISKFEKELREL